MFDMPIDYFQEENDEVIKYFNLEEIFEFQRTHDIQIIRGGDFQFSCYIDHKVYINSLTMMHSLVLGIHTYKVRENGKNNTH